MSFDVTSLFHHLYDVNKNCQSSSMNNTNLAGINPNCNVNCYNTDVIVKKCNCKGKI